MIAFTNVSKQYGAQVLFFDASFQINPGDKVGLVGANGSGKTTIFRLIAGEEQPDDGVVEKPRRLSVGYFRQDTGDLRGRSVLAETVAGSGRTGHRVELPELERLPGRAATTARGVDVERCRRVSRS